MEKYIISILAVLLGVGIVYLAITNSKLSRPWWLPKSMDEDNFFGRFFTGVVGVGFTIIGLAVLVLSILGK